MKFKVKKNPILIILALALIPIGIIGLFTEGTNEGWFGLVIIVIIDIPLLWALLCSYHEITDSHLRIVFGPIVKSIPLYEIKSVHYSYNLISSPAWTFKRIEVMYSNYKTILTSVPLYPQEFHQTLQQHCPNAKIHI